jgi:hypothetical protein
MHGCVHTPSERNTLLSPSPDPHEEIGALLASAAWIDQQGNREKRPGRAAQGVCDNARRAERTGPLGELIMLVIKLI